MSGKKPQLASTYEQSGARSLCKLADDALARLDGLRNADLAGKDVTERTEDERDIPIGRPHDVAELVEAPGRSKRPPDKHLGRESGARRMRWACLRSQEPQAAQQAIESDDGDGASPGNEAEGDLNQHGDDHQTDKLAARIQGAAPTLPWTARYPRDEPPTPESISDTRQATHERRNDGTLHQLQRR